MTSRVPPQLEERGHRPRGRRGKVYGDRYRQAAVIVAAIFAAREKAKKRQFPPLT